MNLPTRKHFVYASLVAVAVGCAYAPTTDVANGPSAATTFCNALAASATKCGQAGDTASCQTSAKRHSDAELSAATECTQKPCDEVDACIDAALGKISTPDGPLSDAGTDASKHDAGVETPKDAGDPPAKSCKGFGKSSICRACQEELCCTEMEDCRNKKDCSAFLDCCASTTCPNGDLSCLNSQCPFPSNDPDAIGAFNTWVDCRAKKCGSECPGKPYW